jgi:flagellar biosynthesis regulator FlaF
MLEERDYSMTMVDFAAEELDIREEEAFGLSRAAVLLDQAKQNRDDTVAMTAALNHNLELWVAIRSLVQRPESGLPKSVEDNLIRLSNFVADTTFRSIDFLEETTIDTLININLQISEGLLEGLANDPG